MIKTILSLLMIATLLVGIYLLLPDAAVRTAPTATVPVETHTVSVRTYQPGDVVPDAELAGDTSRFFTATEIPDSVFARMQGKTFKTECTIARSDLRYLRCLHADKGGRTLVGEMVVNRCIADKVLNILRRLYTARYPIERMLLADNWNADDERTMTANSTSSFNFRFVSRTRRVSKHGMGLAVDINPLYNPCVKQRNGKTYVEPAAGKPYTDRTHKFDYKIERGDLCYRLFTQAGFTWGGNWKSSKDYQHFEINLK